MGKATTAAASGSAGADASSKSRSKSWIKMSDLSSSHEQPSPSTSKGKMQTTTEEEQGIEPVLSGESTSSAHPLQGSGPVIEERDARDGHHGRRHGGNTYSHTHFRVYKRRWFGLAQLVLLNIVVSWDVSRRFLLHPFHPSRFSRDRRLFSRSRRYVCGENGNANLF